MLLGQTRHAFGSWNSKPTIKHQGKRKDTDRNLEKAMVQTVFDRFHYDNYITKSSFTNPQLRGATERKHEVYFLYEMGSEVCGYALGKNEEQDNKEECSQRQHRDKDQQRSEEHTSELQS